jgi:hypothetical protein
MSHTPGPWTIAMDEPYDLRVVAGNRGICEVWLDDAPVVDFNNEQHDNARLIAAAPDLLAALENLLATCNATNAAGRAAEEKARAALKKAMP